MRFLKISQSIIFEEDSVSGLFKKGQVATFSGSLSYNNNDIVLGYLKQEPITCNSLVLYVKGYWAKNWVTDTRELVLVETSKKTNNFSPITLCSYFPNVFREADGYVDETIGQTSKEGQYFFHSGKYTAVTSIKMKKIPIVTAAGIPNPEYCKVKKKTYQMTDRLYVAKNRNKLNFGFLFDFIQPYFGAHQKLIDRYPNQ